MKHINIRSAMSFVIDGNIKLNRAMFEYHMQDETFNMAFKEEDGYTNDIKMPFDMFVAVPKKTTQFKNVQIVNEHEQGIIVSPGSLSLFSVAGEHIFIDFNDKTARIYHSSKTTNIDFERSVIMSEFIKGVYSRLWRVDS